MLSGGKMSCPRKGLPMRVFMACCVVLLCFATPVWAGTLSLEAGSVVLFDMRSKRVLYEQDSMRKIPPASLTKIMAMFVALDVVKSDKLSLRTPIRVSKAAASTGGSSMRLKAGEFVRLDDLLRGMAVVSANDASVAVAEYIAGSQAAFVDMMNRKAKQIGLKDTVFKTPHGLPAKGQVTTAVDMLRLACRYLEAHPAARYYHGSPAMLHNGILMTNTNRLLEQDRVCGLKTGFTKESGYNIILTGNLHGREMVAVLMRAPSVEVRTREAKRLLNYGATLAESLEKKSASYKTLPQAASLSPSSQGGTLR